MTEEPIIIKMNIAHYEAMLKLPLDEEKRSIVKRLLAEAEEHLALAIDSERAAITRAQSDRAAD